MANLDRPSNGSRAWLTPMAVLLVGAAVAFCVVDRLSVNDRNAERRLLEQRRTELSAVALQANPSLGCLLGTAGEAVENACEKKVFSSPENVAAAAALMAEQIALLADGAKFAARGDTDFAASLAPLRRTIELDRYGFAAHVLAVRDGCTAENCPAFALVQDASTLKANLKIRAYETYIDRYVAAWNAPLQQPAAPQPATPPVASAEPPAPSAPEPEHAPVSSKYDFPSAASIPAVSIMNPEPPLPKAEAEPKAVSPADEASAKPRLPPKRPRTEAAAPPAR